MTELLPVPKIRQHPDPVLREVSRPVAVDDDATMAKVRELVMAMREAMYDRGGIGLSAVQIGVPAGVFIVHVRNETSEPLVFVNPELMSVSPDTCEMVEGCLSFGLERDLIERPKRCVVKRYDEYGRRDVYDYRGMTARAIQHEMDHLQGRLFIDFLSKARQRMILRTMSRRADKRPVRVQQAVTI